MPAAQGFLGQAAISELRVVPGDNVDNSALRRRYSDSRIIRESERCQDIPSFGSNCSEIRNVDIPKVGMSGHGN